MELIENYQKALNAIYDHVGYSVEERGLYTLEIMDRTDMFWRISDQEVEYAETIDELECEETVYGAGIFTPNYLNLKNVYEGENFTMIFCDSGLKWFGLFDNSKRIL